MGPSSTTNPANATRTLVAGLGLTFALGTAVAWAEPGRSTAPAPTVEVTAGPVATDLYPGATDGDLVVEVHNHGSVPVRLRSLSATAITTDHDTCPGRVVSLRPLRGDHRIPPGVTEGVRLADVVAMAATAPDDCQGATFTFALDLEVEPVAA